MKTHIKSKLFLSAGDLAKELGVSKNTVTLWVKLGVPCLTIGRQPKSRQGSRPRFELEKVMKWLEERSMQKGGKQ